MVKFSKNCKVKECWQQTKKSKGKKGAIFKKPCVLKGTAVKKGTVVKKA